MNERCNCGASCGENRYHDLGSEYCRHKEREKIYRHAGLSEGQKKLLRHMDEFNTRQIDLPMIFSIPYGTVKSRLSRGRKKLREYDNQH